MIYIGNLDEQLIKVNILHTQAVHDLLKEKFWDKLNDDEKEDMRVEIQWYEDVHLGGWRDDLFNEAYKVLMASENEWITPMRNSFERTFKIDPRFQAA